MILREDPNFFSKVNLTSFSQNLHKKPTIDHNLNFSPKLLFDILNPSDYAFYLQIYTNFYCFLTGAPISSPQTLTPNPHT